MQIDKDQLDKAIDEAFKDLTGKAKRFVAAKEARAGVGLEFNINAGMEHGKAILAITIKAIGKRKKGQPPIFYTEDF